ncbi:hypothetical protein ACFFHJ_15520 [Planotetraspora thailandica]|nr:hypothetical protein [Planotetraspora thailandica]
MNSRVAISVLVVPSAASLAMASSCGISPEGMAAVRGLTLFAQLAEMSRPPGQKIRIA